MSMPDVRTTLKDPNTKVMYHVMAYRPLTREELILAVRMYLSGKKVKKPKPGQEVTIISVIGLDE